MPDLATRDKPSRALGLPAGFAVLVGARLVSNVAIRLVFPFLPQIARGLGTTVDGMGTTLAASQVAALGQLGLGRVVHRIGVRTALVTGHALLAVICLMAAASTGLVWFGVCLGAILLAKGVYDVASTTWIGERVPVERRGRAIGLIETSWAGAFFLGMPLIALVIRAGTWRTPYVLVAIACATSAIVLANRVPPVVEHVTTARVALRPSRRVVAALATPLLFSTGLYSLLVTFATWLEDSHGVSIEGLGIAALAVGLGELGGSSSCALMADRFGPVRTMRGGMALLIPASLAVPLGGAALPLALVLLFVWFGLFEFSYVTLLSWLTELQPDARATIAGMTFASFSTGGLLGSLIGSRLLDRSGMLAVCFAVATLFGAALLLTTVFAREGLVSDEGWSAMRRGAYPGSFNPPTSAHLVIAEAAKHQRRLDHLDLVVSRVALAKGAIEDPPFEVRIDVIAASIEHLPWLDVVVTDAQLVVDIAAGYDVVVMGADKWEQINDPIFYGGSPTARDDAVRRLPELAIAPRPPAALPAGSELVVPTWAGDVSSTLARAGAHHLMTAEARASGAWR